MIYPPNQKPPIWSIDPGVIDYNCQQARIPHPVLAMPMWEGAGNLARDYSGRGNHGTINGADWVSDGLDFIAANNDYVDCGDKEILDLTQSLTIITGINLDNTTAVDAFVSKGTGGEATHAWDLKYHGSPNSFRSSLRSSTGQTNADATTSIVEGVDYQGGVTWDGSDIKMYVDGKHESTTAFTGPIQTNTHSVHIGATSGDVFVYPDGQIYYVYIFPTALSAAQVKFISNNPYFMYQIPEELYGYAAAAGISIPLLMQQMNQFDGGTYALR